MYVAAVVPSVVLPCISAPHWLSRYQVPDSNAVAAARAVVFQIVVRFCTEVHQDLALSTDPREILSIHIRPAGFVTVPSCSRDRLRRGLWRFHCGLRFRYSSCCRRSSTESALAEDVLLDAERAQTTRDEQSDLMEATLFQADSTLKGFDVPEGEATSAAQALGLTASFEEVSRRLGEAGQVRTEQGEFFLSDGSVVTGQVVHVGRIANYGVSDEASGSLIPVGEGKLQIRDGAANTATALAANTAVDQLEIFLFRCR